MEVIFYGVVGFGIYVLFAVVGKGCCSSLSKREVHFGVALVTGPTVDRYFDVDPSLKMTTLCSHGWPRRLLSDAISVLAEIRGKAVTALR